MKTIEEVKKEMKDTENKAMNAIRKIFAMNLNVEDTIKKTFTEINKLNGPWESAPRTYLLLGCAKAITKKHNTPYFLVDADVRDKRRSKKAMEIFLASKPFGIQLHKLGFSPAILFILPGATTPYQSKRNEKIITTVKLPAGNKIRFVQHDYPHLANVPPIENAGKEQMEPFSESQGNIIFKELFAPIGHFIL